MSRKFAFVTLALWVAALVIASASSADHHEKPAGDAATSSEEDPILQKIDEFIAEQSIDRSDPGWKTKLTEPPKQSFDADKSYLWELETNQGPIVIRLMPDVAPMHVTSTIYLTRLGFYDGTAFHRVIPGFMAQGGDPLGNGTGGPGYQYDGEFDRKVKHKRAGMLSMANRGRIGTCADAEGGGSGRPCKKTRDCPGGETCGAYRGTDGSQFFITFAATPHLDDKHTIFGQVVSGKDTLKKLEKYGSRSGRTSEPLELQKASVRVE